MCNECLFVQVYAYPSNTVYGMYIDRSTRKIGDAKYQN